MIKLVGLDIDGTIISQDGKISSQVKDIVRQVKKAGVHVALLSGRNYNGMKYYIDELGLKGISASSNGAEIVAIEDEEIILQEVIPYKLSKEVVDASIRLNLGVINFSNLRVYTEGLDKLPHEYTKILNQEFDYIDDIFENIKIFPSVKLMMVGVQQDLKDLQKLIEEKYNEALNADFSTEYLLEVYSKKADKGIAFNYIREKLGLLKEESMCIGDSENDIPMFRSAGLSVAMGNAINEVKECATDITDDVKNYGAAKAMKKYILD
ncbi:Cof-type HAD-IIB family hydrolase [Alkalibaculum sp. M08DMB]|uniref:Cof-type HAD-IIB family hydrolase n=1 Tax=Alkalibaculum sporogenes TaxID=2655001 RepID=A0A6A7K514_9FIRM|nr:Cof-type HAD-IIB family hydrolase [Alkalibaculum sporogenes]MPW24488.1 Cof-type HAD-IIB family hydrolase [Alkalibaculum sporogenes]